MTPDGAAVGAPVAGRGAVVAVVLRSLASTRSVMSRFLSIATIDAETLTFKASTFLDNAIAALEQGDCKVE